MDEDLPGCGQCFAFPGVVWHHYLDYGKQGCGVLIFLWDSDFDSRFKKKLGLRLQPLKIPRLRLRLLVKVGHRLLYLCDCDSVLSERCRQTDSEDLKK